MTNPPQPLFTPEAIRIRVDELALEIGRDFGGSDFTVITILKGGFVFAADLLRALSLQGLRPGVDFMSLSSYGSGTSSSREVKMGLEPSLPLRGKRILLIDDILDTGLTLQAAVRLLTERGASEVRPCVLLDKPSRRDVPIAAVYTGFQIANVFVVGYGLDFDNRFRELPGLAILDPDSPA